MNYTFPPFIEKFNNNKTNLIFDYKVGNISNDNEAINWLRKNFRYNEYEFVVNAPSEWLNLLSQSNVNKL